MKGFYFSVSVFLTVLLLIIGFENLNTSIQNWSFLFFKFGQYDTFIMICGISFIGFFVGVFFTLFIRAVLNKDEEETGSEVF